MPCPVEAQGPHLEPGLASLGLSCIFDGQSMSLHEPPNLDYASRSIGVSVTGMSVNKAVSINYFQKKNIQCLIGIDVMRNTFLMFRL